MLKTVLRGARTHNLKSLDLSLEPGELVVLTGVSGAGKSSLALDTLYTEGQRRFVESFSPYARQFLERLERPPMDALEPVPAGVAVDRKAPIKSSRSTVATMADIEPYLAALFVREAVALCPIHQLEAVDLDAERAAQRSVEELGGKAKGNRAVITYPLPVTDRESYLETRETLAREGFRRLWHRGRVTDLDELRPSEAVRSNPEVVVDRVKVDAREHSRIASSLEAAFMRGDGRARMHAEEQALDLRRGLGCPKCGIALLPPRAGLFSYESPLGACPTCRGFGRTIGIDLHKVIPDPSRTLERGAIRPWRGKSTTWERTALGKLCRRHGVSMKVPWEKLSTKHQQVVLEGDGSWDEGAFPGVLGWFAWLETRTYKMHVRVLLSRYRSYDPCPECQGRRLNEVALSFRVMGRSIADWHELEVRAARDLISALPTKTGQGEMACRELQARLDYLDKVGLGYLTLDRQARTLSGGEAQRVTLTAALGTSLHNALFVLDEPTVGLHASDIAPLTEMLRQLASRGNSVLVVEHDPAIIAAADRVVELGPGAGNEGGHITADGSPSQVIRAGGAAARALKSRAVTHRPSRAATGWLRVRGAREHNLQNVDISIPLGVVAALTGPSGSGKSTLAVSIIYRALARQLGDHDAALAGDHDALEIEGNLRRVVLVDQSPLGRTSRGNAATYTKAWDHIRTLFAKEPEAERLDLTPSHFSFNVAGGRCDVCSGEGYETVEMQFLADVRLICPVCQGRRFNKDVLSVRHRGLGIDEVLELTVTSALARFSDHTGLLRALGPLEQLGLGYLTLGQPLSTLSGGEAQRLKLARALAEDLRAALIIVDEPSAGLHADEVAHVLEASDILVKGGGSVLLIDHDLQLIAAADHVLDLGPGGGLAGGRLVASGSPQEIIDAGTATGRALQTQRKRSKLSGRRRQRSRSAPQLAVTRAREHNLKEVSCQIPHDSLCVVTGPSGSGKSTLAFDVVFAEGQRRFLETLTPYARQFLPTMPRPDVDSVTGVPPSIALEQRTSRAGARSTVATVTEVAHFLRLLYARLGTPYCPTHHQPIEHSHPQEILERIRALRGHQELLAPVVAGRKGTYLDVFNNAAREGIVEAYCDGERVETDSPPELDRRREHDIDLIIMPRTATKHVELPELERALRWGKGAVKLRGKQDEQLFSTHSACPKCGLSIPELDPRWFSFATRQGQCSRCEGQGVLVAATGRGRRAKESAPVKPCPECGGTRLASIPREVRLDEETYPEMVSRSVRSALERVREWRFPRARQAIAAPIINELERRLSFLRQVGLDYLSLDRLAPTLSGGEMQRLRLAAQLGAGLTGALYVLDEPTIGLHPRDTGRLLSNLRHLVDLGSTVVVVEHDADTIRAADYVIDLGPEGGAGGGKIVAQGSAEKVLASRRSPTGRVLRQAPRLREPSAIDPERGWLELSQATAHNLKQVDLRLPLGALTVVAGVSGSGKSTLVRQVLLPAVRRALGLAAPEAREFKRLVGHKPLKRALAIDQSPIGRTPRSVPATFLGIWDTIRALFATTPEAQAAGYKAARFSFNTAAGGRCGTCEGQGVISHEMSFLPDVVAPCPSCEGQRFEPRTLSIRYLGSSIGEILGMTVEQAATLFRNHPNIRRPLETLQDLGAGYITLGQGSHTLSGGEAQRLKLAAELTASARHEPTLYVLDEPTTGLHLADVEKLMNVLGRLVERGDTLVVIEHHPWVIAGADWIVELGPEGGDAGGRIVAEGTRHALVKAKTATGHVIAQLDV